MRMPKSSGKARNPEQDPKIRKEVERLEEDSTPATPAIYEAVRRLGKEEMERPAVSLWWSGLAGGLSISFSLLAQGILRSHLPEAQWTSLIVAMGYPVGFLMVVLSRQQLFTETTITVMLPLMKEPTRRHFAGAARMWAVVLAANLVGTFFAALLCTFVPVVSPELRDSMIAISREAMDHSWLDMGCRGITAGFLMAAVVWLLPAAGQAQFHIVALITYVIGAGDFSHVVAGSMEAFLAALNGHMSVASLLGNFFGPVLAGNVIGGTALFAVISYAQVMKEI
ncbi:MAG TPA: formate/nitrite transporter family protein [Usitatibacter sp.]|nr:formate/nitrite transporter family protein [Usitatibacter sp.]